MNNNNNNNNNNKFTLSVNLLIEISISEHQICKIMKESKQLDPLVPQIITITEKTFAYNL